MIPDEALFQLRDQLQTLLRSASAAQISFLPGSLEIAGDKAQLASAWELRLSLADGSRNSRKGNTLFVFDRKSGLVTAMKGDLFWQIPASAGEAAGGTPSAAIISKASLKAHTGPASGCFIFEGAGVGSLSEGDFFWSLAESHPHIFPANGARLLRMGSKDIEEINAAPTEGYGETGSDLAEGRTYAFLTHNGRYAVIQAERIDESSGVMSFSYKYQPQQGSSRF